MTVFDGSVVTECHPNATLTEIMLILISIRKIRASIIPFISTDLQYYQMKNKIIQVLTIKKPDLITAAVIPEVQLQLSSYNCSVKYEKNLKLQLCKS
jgi:hypothetical protein